MVFLARCSFFDKKYRALSSSNAFFFGIFIFAVASSGIGVAMWINENSIGSGSNSRLFDIVLAERVLAWSDLFSTYNTQVSIPHNESGLAALLHYPRRPRGIVRSESSGQQWWRSFLFLVRWIVLDYTAGGSLSSFSGIVIGPLKSQQRMDGVCLRSWTATTYLHCNDNLEEDGL